MLKTPHFIVLLISLFILTGCVAGENPEKTIEADYKQKCTSIGQGTGDAFVECKKRLHRERDKAWRKELEKRDKERERRRLCGRPRGC